MWRKIKNLILIISFISALLSALILIETNQFESPTGLFLVLVNIVYMFWFGTANFKRKI